MGLGPFKNGRHQPITPYKGSWAEKMEKERNERASTPTRGSAAPK